MPDEFPDRRIPAIDAGADSDPFEPPELPDELIDELLAGARTPEEITGPEGLDTIGVDDYMAGLVMFADTVVPGSLRVDGNIGDERNALLLVTAKTAGAPMGSMRLPAARLYLLDENNKIKSEQVIFYAVPD